MGAGCCGYASVLRALKLQIAAKNSSGVVVGEYSCRTAMIISASHFIKPVGFATASHLIL